MCAEYERVERVVQQDVWSEETVQNHSAYATAEKEPDEARMVKKFRRAAAGLEEQLPSDLRPAHVLKRTCDYLFEDVLGNARALEKVHHFVWDRSRAIRNDFSIQQLNKPEDLRLAIECYERIARFHIVSLHQLAVHPKPYEKYDAQQEREQLDRTLLSLMQYYDDCRGRVRLDNEAEFRAYCVIFQLQDPTPDLEDRVQTWPRTVMYDLRVRKALELYAAACNTQDSQGPLKPRATHLIAQQDWQRFWSIVGSNQVSYLMACVAEIYFNLVRRTVLNALLRSCRMSNTRADSDWTIDLLCEVLAFDEHSEVHTFCEAYGFSFAQRDDGQEYLDLTSVKLRELPQPNASLPKQWKSELVEGKRWGRTLSAIINGMTVDAAQEAGQVVQEEDEGMVDVQSEDDTVCATDDHDDGESLFVPAGSYQDEKPAVTFDFKPATNGIVAPTNGTANPPASSFSFGKPSGGGFGAPSSSAFGPFANSIFGSSSESPVISPAGSANGDSPSIFANPSTGSGLAPPSASATSLGGFAAPAATSNPFASSASSVLPAPAEKKSAFSFVPSAATPATKAITAEPNAAIEPPKFTPSTFSFGSPAIKTQADKVTAPPLNNGLFSGTPSGGSIFDKPSSADVASSAFESSGFAGFGAPAKPLQSSDDVTSKSAPSFSFDSAPPGVSQANAPSVPSNALQTKAANAQPHFTPVNTTPSVPAPVSAVTTSTAATSAPRRYSKSDNANKPLTPSRLSHSFSAEESGGTDKSSDLTQLPSEVQVDSQTSRKAGKIGKPMLSPEIDSANEFRQIIARIAREVTIDDVNGFLEQFVAFTAEKVVREVQDQVLIDEADRFRFSKLAQRYGDHWRSKVRRKNMHNKGAARRQRALDALKASKSQGPESRASLAGSSSVSVGPRGSEVRIQMDRLSKEQSTRRVSEQETGQATERPLSSGRNDRASVRQNGHKRLKSTSHVDDRGRVTKAEPVSNTTADLLKRSAFLGFSMPQEAPARGSTTQSNYFRLKAMGVAAVDKSRGVKRGREGSIDTETQVSRSPSERADRAVASVQRARERAAGSPQQQLVVTETNEEDDALLARLKAARESLVNNERRMRIVTAHKELQQSAPSPPSADSPTLARARSEARWRASYAGSGKATPPRDVPAYRLRESRFVPREKYGLAIDKAREMRESRSRDTSRPESRFDDRIFDSPSINQAQQPEPAINGTAPFRASPANHGTFTPNGLPYTTPRPRSTGLNDRPANKSHTPERPVGASQETPFSFANHQIPSFPAHGFLSVNGSVQKPSIEPSFDRHSNSPFEAQQINTFHTGDHNAQQPSRIDSQDHTVAQSQIEQSLAKSFGVSHGFAHFGGQESPTQQTRSPFDAASQMASQAVTILGEDEEIDETQQPPYVNGFSRQTSTVGTPPEPNFNEFVDDGRESEDDTQRPYDYANSFSALAGHNDETAQSENTEDTEEDGSTGYGYYEQRNAGRGEAAPEFVDGEDEEDEDEDEEDGDTEEYDEDGEDTEQTLRYNGQALDGDGMEDSEESESDEEETFGMRARQQHLPPNPSQFEAVGGTAEEAIELSD